MDVVQPSYPESLIKYLILAALSVLDLMMKCKITIA